MGGVSRLRRSGAATGRLTGPGTLAGLVERNGDSVLVTGAAGLVGRAVCERLRSDRRAVIATYLTSNPPAAPAGVTWVRADLRDPGFVEVLGELSAIVHLAAVIPSGDESIAELAAANRAMDDNVLGVAAVRGISVVYASTGALYAEPLPATGWSEVGPITPVGPYLEEKAWAEVRGATLARHAGSSFTALRINAPYGPEQRNRTVIQVFVEQALAGGPIRYFGSGSREQEFTFVSDVADACAAALALVLGGRGGTFNIAGGGPVTMRRLAEIVAECAGLGPDAAVPAGRPDPQEGRRVAFDLRLAAERLGWSPRVTLADGIRQCLNGRGHE
jgi:nucleoside-diphosphate-sugar epimerase